MPIPIRSMETDHDFRITFSIGSIGLWKSTEDRSISEKQGLLGLLVSIKAKGFNLRLLLWQNYGESLVNLDINGMNHVFDNIRLFSQNFSTTQERIS